jgi:hypothetical protein
MKTPCPYSFPIFLLFDAECHRSDSVPHHSDFSSQEMITRTILHEFVDRYDLFCAAQPLRMIKVEHQAQERLPRAGGVFVDGSWKGPSQAPPENQACALTANL